MEKINLYFFAALCSGMLFLDIVTNRRAFIADGKVRITSCLAALAAMTSDFFVNGHNLPVLDFDACLALGNSFLLSHPSSFESARRPEISIIIALTVSLTAISPFSRISEAVPKPTVFVTAAIMLMTVNLIHSANDRFSTLYHIRRNACRTYPAADVERLVCYLVLSLLISILQAVGRFPERLGIWAGECEALLLSTFMFALYYRFCTGRKILPEGKGPKTGYELPGSDASRPEGKGEGGLSLEEMYVKIQEYMEEARPYLDEKFSLADMASAIGTNKAYVSRAVNAMFGNNFCQFVNYYRIQYAADIMRKDRRLKVLEVSMMSGFHSVASFNMAFKLYMNDLPSEFTRNFHSRSLSIPVEPGQ